MADGEEDLTWLHPIPMSRDERDFLDERETQLYDTIGWGYYQLGDPDDGDDDAEVEAG